MRTVALRGRVVTDHEVWTEGTVLLEGSRVAQVSREPLDADPGARLEPPPPNHRPVIERTARTSATGETS